MKRSIHIAMHFCERFNDKFRLVHLLNQLCGQREHYFVDQNIIQSLTCSELPKLVPGFEMHLVKHFSVIFCEYKHLC